MKMQKISATIGAAAVGLLTAAALAQTNYTVSYTDGGTWNTVYAQGFNTSLGASPTPTANTGDPVTLSQFSFYKSGNSDSATNIQLAIFNTMYPNTAAMSTDPSTGFVGLSTNTIASTASLNTGDPINFMFNNLSLAYGSDYSAIFVNDSGGTLTPVLVSALTTNYVQESDSNYHPATNYGTEGEYQYTTTNYISSGYFSAFSYAGDANFTANLTAAPEPASLGLIAAAGLLLARRRK
ncbi:MAG TPA: PEP-CTERM sorting domain-containing protein [Tepidisphaeraceae bacterium]|jgi:hypothetical protein